MAYGYTEVDFAQHLLRPITALAAWLHFLPGPPGGGFERRGGALEQALTNCLFSLQAAEGRTFDDGEAEGSPENNAQCWRLACALGGLFTNLADVLARIEVASDDGVLWPGEAMPLLQWLESLRASRYHYRWKRTSVPDRQHAFYAAVRCIDPVVMSFLVEGNRDIARALLTNISGLAGRSDDALSDVVSKVAVAVAAHERSDSTSAPPDDLLVSTLKRLFGTSDWLPNSPGGHVWYGQDGLYLLWPESAIKILQSLPKGARAIPGFGSHDDLLGHLAARGLIAATPSPLVSIRPPGSTKPHAAVRILEPSQLFSDREPRAAALQFRLALPDSHSVECVESESSLPPTGAEGQTLSKADNRGS
ncbi:MAG TPA: TraI domain-containing protein, partial [Burkholderiaceae bacterium]|nr:TraI domain-containing protein [Burkholderiaceae bacterium]